jgi:hypothetical protein
MENYSIFQKGTVPTGIQIFLTVTKLSEIWVWNPGSGTNLSRIRTSIQGSKKAPDPGSATLSEKVTISHLWVIETC